VRGVDYVLHQAAIPSVPRSVEDPITSNRANIDASLNLLVAARDAGVKRVVYAGSSSAYGNSATMPKVETMPTGPLSPYALQKLVAEQYAQMFTTLYGLETVTTRYFNVFGPRPGSVLAVFRRDLAVHQGALRGSATQDLRRRRAHARLHLCRQLWWTACCGPVSAKDASGEVINVADQRTRVVESVVHDTARSDRYPTSNRVYDKPRAGDVRDSQADIGKAARLLGYKPLVTFEPGPQEHR
jgi:UDP-glucose 4-epimerase